MNKLPELNLDSYSNYFHKEIEIEGKSYLLYGTTEYPLDRSVEVGLYEYTDNKVGKKITSMSWIPSLPLNLN